MRKVEEYAVIRDGGKQYRVSVGDTIYVELRKDPLPKVIEFDDILAVRKGEEMQAGPAAKGRRVTGEVEGAVLPEKVTSIAVRMEQCGVYEISLGDTTGMADPRCVRAVCERVRERLTTASLAAHFHQCDGIEFANVLAALEAGITVFDAAVGGLGGCPYAPGATGNIATETLVEMFDRMGISTGIDSATIKECGQFAKSLA